MWLFELLSLSCELELIIIKKISRLVVFETQFYYSIWFFWGETKVSEPTKNKIKVLIYWSAKPNAIKETNEYK